MKKTTSYFLKFSLPVFFMVFHFNSLAQYNKDLHPIVLKKGILNTKYIIDGHTFESPYALQIPLMQVRDSQLTRDFNVFKKSRNTARIIKLVSSGISLYAFFNRDRILGSTYWTTLGTAGALSAFYDIKSGIFLDKAVGRYNKIVSGMEIGLRYDKTYLGNSFLSIGMSHRF